MTTSETKMKRPRQWTADWWRSETPIHRWSLLGFTAAGFALRLFYLFQPIRYDEAYTYLSFAAQPLAKGLSFYSYQNNHPLNTLATHLLAKVASQPWVLRLPDLIAGVLLVPLVYIVIRKLYNRNAALVAAALVVPASQLVDFSTQMRGYSVQALLFLALILIVLALLKRDRVGLWLAFIVTTVLGFYEVPTFLYFFPVALVFFAVQAWRKENRGMLYLKGSLYTLAAALATVALYTPFILRSGLDSLLEATKPLPWHTFAAGAFGNLRGIWQGWNIGLPLVLSLLVLLGFFVAMVFNRRLSEYKVGLPLISVAWFFALYLFQRVFLYLRNMIPFLPLYLGAAAAGLWYLGTLLNTVLQKEREKKGRKALAVSPVTGIILLVALVVLLTIQITAAATPYQKLDNGAVDVSTFVDAPKVTSWLKPVLKPGDLVSGYADLTSAELQYYFEKDGVPVRYLYPLMPTPDHPEWEGWLANPGDIQRVFFVSNEIEVRVSGTRVTARNMIAADVRARNAAGLDMDNFRKVKTVFTTPFTTIDEWVRVR